ncbi:TetR/AcrR family transcriptional regulator [Parahaliea aestuarii]|uniref:TetR/AcrR family transcriptional regulator n=1 Tax=Parahaliea aestuarii TaxID=1852021 RepID=A0A5C9A759_9GAMM|nr:TetR/AcrR family transcriptional regulator [Parahaliea aestuarii]TXS95051.1 TetR/AcrR family transcriptional regulator [Parahaliea aestuarii]
MTAAQKAAKKTRGRPRRGDGWQAEKSAITRTAILDAAEECLVERGYSRTTTAMIAEYAGVSRGAMMHHFPSRIAVIRAVVDHLHEKRLGEYRNLMEGIDNPEQALTREAIRKSVESAWRYVNLPSFVAYQELLAAARTDPELNDVLERTEKDVEGLFLQTVKQVFPHWESLGVLEVANDLIQFCMRGMALSHMATNKKRRAKRMIELMTDQLEALYAQAESGKA